MKSFSTLDSLLFTMLIPIGIGIKNRKLLSPEMTSVLLLMFVCLITQSVVIYLRTFQINNLWLGHIYVPLEFVLLANAYRIRLRKQIPQKVIGSIMVLFPLLALLNTLFLQDLTQNNSNVRTLEVVLLIFLALSYFYTLMKNLSFKRPERDPFFWVNTGVLIYLSSSLFLFMYSNILLQYSNTLGHLVWDIHKVFLFFYYSAIAIGLWILPKK